MLGDRVLVTGGAGFIGSHVVDTLRSHGFEPFVLDDYSSGRREHLPPDVPCFTADVRDAGAVARVMQEVQPRFISHQAAQMSVSHSVRQPAFDADINIMGLLSVLEAARATGVRRVVFASSGGVLYGDVEAPAAEDHPIQPISPYGISKWAGERYLEFYAREYGLQAVALRYSNVYGPRQNPLGEAGVVAIFCRRLLTGEPLVINGDGRYVRDYVYVTDVAQANLLALTAPLPSNFVALNIGTGVGTDVNQLEAQLRRAMIEHLQTGGVRGGAGAPAVGSATGASAAGDAASQVAKTGPAGGGGAQGTRGMPDTPGQRSPQDIRPLPPVQHGPARPGDLRSNLVAPGAAATIIGWRPTVAIDEGLRRTAGWFASSNA